MYLFLSFVISLISLYYIGVIIDSHRTDTSYLTPLIILLIYSVWSIIRELRTNPVSWLSMDFDDGNYSHYDRTYETKRQNYGSNNIDYWRNYNTVAKKNVEYFVQDKKSEKDDTQVFVHYPSNKEVREKIKELEKSRWFRIKRSFCSAFGIDITEQYRRKIKTVTKLKANQIVRPINKEDHSRFIPINALENEYNNVAKCVGRSFEVTFDDVVNESEESSENNL